MYKLSVQSLGFVIIIDRVFKTRHTFNLEFGDSNPRHFPIYYYLMVTGSCLNYVLPLLETPLTIGLTWI